MSSSVTAEELSGDEMKGKDQLIRSGIEVARWRARLPLRFCRFYLCCCRRHQPHSHTTRLRAALHRRLLWPPALAPPPPSAFVRCSAAAFGLHPFLRRRLRPPSRTRRVRARRCGAAATRPSSVTLPNCDGCADGSYVVQPRTAATGRRVCRQSEREPKMG